MSFAVIVMIFAGFAGNETVKPKYAKEDILVGIETVDIETPDVSYAPEPTATHIPVRKDKPKKKKKRKIYKGVFELTAYCPCCDCSDGYGRNTSTGKRAVQGRTIAVDHKIIPYGTVIYIQGLGRYVAEDCGGDVDGKRIDVFFNHHADTKIFGRQKRKVYIIRRNKH